MKKTFLLIVIASLLFWSCKKDEEPINEETFIYGSVSDIDSNVYKTVILGAQEWMAENLNVDHYRNGDLIPQITGSAEWANMTTGAWCYYENNSSNGLIYGKLYNWLAVNDPRGLAPAGWHVPNYGEWFILVDNLGAEVACGKMKETGTTHWNSPNTDATNSSGFSAIPGGYGGDDGSFGDIGRRGYWWSSTEYDTSDAMFITLPDEYGFVNMWKCYKQSGFSVRCLRGLTRNN